MHDYIVLLKVKRIHTKGLARGQGELFDKR
jgi:hypothetical protein